MKEYYNLLAEKATINYKIRQERKYLHRLLYKQNKWNFILMDMIVILIIFLNLSALAMTNLMVTKTDADNGVKTIVYEVNPAAAKIHNFQQHSEYKPLYQGFIKQILIWIILIIIYLYYRQNTYSDILLFGMNIIVAFYFIAISADFFNNFGYVIGKMVFQ